MLLDYEAKRQVARFEPAFDPDEREVRSFFFTHRLKSELEQLGAGQTRTYLGKVRASLREYVCGEEIADDESVFKKLVPWGDDIWEFRITFTPQARIFGAFVSFNMFLGITGRLREDCADDGFEEAMDIVRDDWARLFGTARRYRGALLDHCISNVC
ncbi:MAG TPA: hypothetical protein VF605_18065 [Allosphingosinicella sp.]|jgi:hypothetical protein